MGKTIFAVFDKQTPEQKEIIESVITYAFEAPECGFEETILNGTAESALIRYSLSLVSDGLWPSHLNSKTPTVKSSILKIRDSLSDYFKRAKGAGGAADLLEQCTRDEMPKFIVDTLLAIQRIIEPNTTL